MYVVDLGVAADLPPRTVAARPQGAPRHVGPRDRTGDDHRRGAAGDPGRRRGRAPAGRRGLRLPAHRRHGHRATPPRRPRSSPRSPVRHRPPSIGRGTGVDDPTLARKVAVVTAALRDRAGHRRPGGDAGRRWAASSTPGWPGFLLGAAARQVPVVLDGVIAGAAALVAAALAPEVVGLLLRGAPQRRARARGRPRPPRAASADRPRPAARRGDRRGAGLPGGRVGRGRAPRDGDVRLRRGHPQGRRVSDFPPYPSGLRLQGRRVLVVGGGHVAQRRMPRLLGRRRRRRRGLPGDHARGRGPRRRRGDPLARARLRAGRRRGGVVRHRGHRRPRRERRGERGVRGAPDLLRACRRRDPGHRLDAGRGPARRRHRGGARQPGAPTLRRRCATRSSRRCATARSRRRTTTSASRAWCWSAAGRVTPSW